MRSERGRFFFATEDTRLGQLLSTAVDDEFVHDLVGDSLAGTVILIFDCCHSGAFARGLTARSDVEVHPERVVEGPGRVALTASTALEYAFEADAPAGETREFRGPAVASLFTQHLVAGLRSGDADRNEDGQITVDELYDHIRGELRRAAVPQKPGISPGAHGQIAIARSGRGVAALPAWIRELIEHELPEKRLAAVVPLQARARSADAREAAAARAVLERLARDDSNMVCSAALEALRSIDPRPVLTRRRWPARPVLVAAGAALAAVGALLAFCSCGATIRPSLMTSMGMVARRSS